MRRRYLIAALCCTLVSPSRLLAQGADWLEFKSDHFVVFTQSKDAQLAQQVLSHSENEYERIAVWIGYARRDQFWTWDKRCKIYIYPTRLDYLTKTGQSQWSSGMALLEKRMIISHSEAADFLDSVLPHELAHLILRDFAGGKSAGIPLWLDEGVAMAQEKFKQKEFRLLVKEMKEKKKWIPFEAMMKIQSVGRFQGAEAAAFYAQAQSVITFLIENYGSERFASFCRSLRDKASPEEALRKNYPKEFSTLTDFERKWAAYAEQ